MKTNYDKFKELSLSLRIAEWMEKHKNQISAEAWENLNDIIRDSGKQHAAY